jgi:hypothetical protein
MSREPESFLVDKILIHIFKGVFFLYFLLCFKTEIKEIDQDIQECKSEFEAKHLLLKDFDFKVEMRRL